MFYLIISVILAAGEGTRMKSKYSKVTQKILNKPMIDYVLKASEETGIEKNVILVGRNKSVMEELYGHKDYVFIEQKIGPEFPYGTGYAVKLAIDEISDDDDVLILFGDTPLITSDSLREFINAHKASGSVLTVMTGFLDDATSYGRIVKDSEGYLKKIVEEKDCTEEEKKIKEFNSGIYLVRGKELKASLEKISTDNAQGEMYLTDIIEILVNEGYKLTSYQISDVREIFGINSKDQLANAQEIMRMRVNTKLMKAGVVMENPSNIFIEPGVEIGRDTEIRSGARITGKTVIGEDCLITGDTEIIESTIGNSVAIKSSVVEYSEIEDNADMGPFAHLRPGSKLGEKVHIGNFVEVKKASLGKGTKAGHLTYIGDASLGENINVGCGTIFANYDGMKKHHTVVGDGAFIGSNSNLVAPVEVGKDSFIAAGSTVIDDVEEGALYINRAEARQIKEWVYRKIKK